MADSTLHGEAAEGKKRERHRSLAGRRIVGVTRTTAQERPSRPRRLARAHERGHGQDNIKARVLSEPGLLLQIAKMGGKAGEDVSLSRSLKRFHSTAPPEQCIRGTTLVVFGGGRSGRWDCLLAPWSR